MTEQACDHCKENGHLGREIRAYSFVTAKGASVVRFLHASDGGRPCYQQYETKYRAWLAEQRARAVANG